MHLCARTERNVEYWINVKYCLVDDVCRGRICSHNQMFTVRSRAVISCYSTLEEAGMLKILHGPRVCRERESGRPPKHVRARPSQLGLPWFLSIHPYRLSPLFRNICSAAITARWTFRRDEVSVRWVRRVPLDAWYPSLSFKLHVNVSLKEIRISNF